MSTVEHGKIIVVQRRSYGTGSLLLRADSNGRESWYGQWRVDGRLVKRKLGAKRIDGRTGLTKSEAERELRKLIEQSEREPDLEPVPIEEAGRRWVAHLQLMGRKKSTLMDYESTIRVHLAPFFGDMPLNAMQPRDVERFMQHKTDQGRSPKSIRNWLGVLHTLMSFAERREWCVRNPCRQVDFPRIPETDADIRFLDVEQLEALLRAVDLEHEWGPTEHALYLTAAMTGLRQGELLALRWRDIDWASYRVRVRRNFVRGEFGTPKSRRSSRSVPLADRVLAELDAHFRRSLRQGDDDLVFGHPVCRCARCRSGSDTATSRPR